MTLASGIMNQMLFRTRLWIYCVNEEIVRDLGGNYQIMSNFSLTHK